MPRVGGGLDAEAEDALRAARSEGVRVIDAVAAGERRQDERQELVAAVCLAGLATEVEVAIDELSKTQASGQGGRQEEPRVGHQAVVVEGRVEPVEAMR